NEKEVVDVEQYLLEADEGSGINLSEALERAKENRRKLLEGFKIYITDHVPGGFDTMKEIVNANGGKAIIWKGPRNHSIEPYDSDRHGEESRLVLLSSSEDEKYHKGFNKLAKEYGWEPRVFHTDWLLTAAMRQEIDWDSDFKV